MFDTLLYNAQGELTECTHGKIAVPLDGQWLTAALHCGLLPGVGRAHFIAQGRLKEAVFTLADLPRMQGRAFVNRLRGVGGRAAGGSGRLSASSGLAMPPAACIKRIAQP